MKDKKLFNYIKSSTDDIKVNDYSDKIIENVDHIIKPKALVIKKKNYLLPLTAVFSACAVIAIGSVVIFNKTNTNNTNNGRTVFDEKLYQNTSYEFVTIGNVISAYTDVKKSKKYTDDEFVLMANEVNDYIFSCEQLIDSDNIKYVKKDNENNQFDYDYQMIISYDNKDIYCYYNEYNKNKNKNKAKMEGVVVIDGSIYDFDGKRENDDGEDELTMYVYLSQDSRSSFIKIENEREIEDDEIEFEYKITEHRSGKEISKVEIEINVEENETTFEIEKEINKNKEQYKFKINKDKEDLEDEEYCNDALYFIEAEVEKEGYENIDFKIRTDIDILIVRFII